MSKDYSVSGVDRGSVPRRGINYSQVWKVSWEAHRIMRRKTFSGLGLRWGTLLCAVVFETWGFHRREIRRNILPQLSAILLQICLWRLRQKCVTHLWWWRILLMPKHDAVYRLCTRKVKLAIHVHTTRRARMHEICPFEISSVLLIPSAATATFSAKRVFRFPTLFFFF